MAEYAEWLDTLVEEKGFDTEHIFEVEGPCWGLNLIPLGCVLDAIKGTCREEQKAIRAKIVYLDFMNADIMDYFGHLAQALAK